MIFNEPKHEQKDNDSGLSRRGFIKLAAVGGGGLVLGKIPGFLGTVSEVADGFNFIRERQLSKQGERYLPTNLEYMISPEATNTIYQKLELDKKFPDTLTPDSFQVIAQKIARLFNLYFSPTSHEQKRSRTRVQCSL